MVPILSLWLPIVLSVVAVFVVSFLLWAVLPWHQSDYGGLPNEEAARQALKGAEPGQYTLPHCPTKEEMDKPEQQQRFREGPVGFVVLKPTGLPNMAKTLGLWLVYVLAVTAVVAYAAGRNLAPAADYLAIFQAVGVTAWLAYGAAYVQEGIWFGRPWRFVIKTLIDALIYAVVTAGFFGWLWPAT